MPTVRVIRYCSFFRGRVKGASMSSMNGGGGVVFNLRFWGVGFSPLVRSIIFFFFYGAHAICRCAGVDYRMVCHIVVGVKYRFFWSTFNNFQGRGKGL